MDIYKQITRNKIDSVILMVLALTPFALVMVLLVWLESLLYVRVSDLRPAIGLVIVAALAAGLILYRQSRWLILRSCWAAPAFDGPASELIDIVEELAIGAGIPYPEVYVAEDKSPNAFSFGLSPKRATIVVNSGTLEKLSRPELEAVVAHEVSHIRNYDILFSTLMAGFLIMAAKPLAPWRLPNCYAQVEANGLIFFLIAGLGVKVAQLGFSRDREYVADASAVLLTHNPGALASALEKIRDDKATPLVLSKGLGSLYIVNPLMKFYMDRPLVDSHPPIERRIEILEAMASNGEEPATAY